MKKIIGLVLLLVTLAILPGCELSSSSYDVYASIYPIEFMVKRIVGDHLTVGSSYPRGADVHEYEPPANQIVKMSRSKILFFIGAGLEGFLVNAENSVFVNSGCELVELSTYVTLVNFGDAEAHEDHNHIWDPHIWLDPIRMITLAGVIRDKVVTIDPDHTADYEANTEVLITDLQTLHNTYQSLLNVSTYSTKTIVVDHDAYVYWEDRYGIERIHTRIENHSCEIIPSEFTKNIDLINSLGIKYIAVTKNVSSCPVVNQYIQQAGMTIEYLHSLSTITKAEEDSGLDYFEIMYTNLSILTKILPKVQSQ
ncbi:MAG: zinc ABC transporter substrate-binding protein [Bacilli bacterium]|nr:zinc ABC transporter substrate-binding protein [Bacilli bacterium]